jgi:cobalt-zinc-cadmium efflux system membrane fusion protein
MLKHITSYNIKTLAILFIVVFISSCNQTATTKEEHLAVEHTEATEVKLTPEQVQAINLKTDTISFRNLKSSLKVNGKLTLPPQNQAQVSVLIGGIVKDIPVTEGVFVSKGQTLAILENTECLQTQQEFLENQSSLKFLSAEYTRQKELQKESINSAKTFQQAEADYNNALTKNKALTEKLKLFGIYAQNLTNAQISSSFAITAPISGYIKHIDIFIGKFAEPNKQLFEIVDNRFLHIDLTVYEQDVSKIKTGQQVTFTIINDPHHAHSATIFSVNRAFEDNQQAVIAHAKISQTDDDQLLPGMFIEARVQVDDYKAMSLPNDAIVSNGGEHYIYIEREPNTFQQIEVKTGTTDMGFTEIIPLKAVSLEAKVVTTGAYYLLSQLTKGEGEHD